MVCPVSWLALMVPNRILLDASRSSHAAGGPIPILATTLTKDWAALTSSRTTPRGTPSARRCAAPPAWGRVRPPTRRSKRRGGWRRSRRRPRRRGHWVGTPTIRSSALQIATVVKVHPPFVAQISICSELRHLMVEPDPCLWSSRLAANAANRAWGGTLLVETRASAAVGKLLRATIRLSRGLQPVEGIDSGIWCVCGWHMPYTAAARVAPMRAVHSRTRVSITASVDDEVGLKAWDCRPHLRVNQIHIVNLVVGLTPL